MSSRRERDHLLGGSAGLDDALTLHARVWEPEAERMLDRIGVAPGARCVDVACGTMGILAALSRRAGPGGRVVGVDSDARALAVARTYVEREGLKNVELSQADACHTSLPRGSFDLVHARFVLAPLGREEELLRELVALAAPGGVIALQEPDAGSWACHPEPPAFPQLREAILRALRRGGGDFNAGRRIFGLLRDAGLQNVQIRPAVLALQSGHPYMRLPALFAESLRSQIVDGGILRAADLDRAVAGYEEFLREPGGYMIPFTMLQAWGRKARR
jgi:SAM-dependent methyltransferase